MTPCAFGMPHTKNTLLFPDKTEQITADRRVIGGVRRGDRWVIKRCTEHAIAGDISSSVAAALESPAAKFLAGAMSLSR